MSQQMRGKVHHDWSRQLAYLRFDSKRRKIIGAVHNHPTFTKGARITTATTKAPSSGTANPPQQQQKADTVRKLRDLRADQNRLQKAENTLVMRYRPTTSGTKRRAAEDYAHPASRPTNAWNKNNIPTRLKTPRNDTSQQATKKRRTQTSVRWSSKERHKCSRERILGIHVQDMGCQYEKKNCGCTTEGGKKDGQ